MESLTLWLSAAPGTAWAGLARDSHSLWPTCPWGISWIQVSRERSPVTGNFLKTSSGGRSCEQVRAPRPCARFRGGGSLWAGPGTRKAACRIRSTLALVGGMLAFIPVHPPPPTSAPAAQPREQSASTQRPYGGHRVQGACTVPSSRHPCGCPAAGVPRPTPPQPRPPEVSLSGSPAGRHTTRALLSWTLACSKLGIFLRQ